MAGRKHMLGASGAFCAGCGIEHEKSGMTRVFIPARGWRYICDSCNREKPYSRENHNTAHKMTLRGVTLSPEMETVSGNPAAVAAVYKLLPTSDCSISGPEYKPPVYLNNAGFKQACRSLDKLVDFGKDSPLTGCHINSGWYDIGYDEDGNPDPIFMPHAAIEAIYQNFDGLFSALHAEICADPDTAGKIWGRYFVGYASDEVNKSSHSFWINLSHENWIEFRLAKFKSATQFFWAACLCQEIVLILRKWYEGKYTTEHAAKRIAGEYLKHVEGKANCQRPERNNHRRAEENR